MKHLRQATLATLLGALAVAVPKPAAGQGTGFDFAFGLWWHDATAHLYT
ncbi:MAG: hypothetical protein IH616_13650, partial [Gemmatimonadales bacterium]|nr:hypothetical protein [Gemmatimonadales bacterium]